VRRNQKRDLSVQKICAAISILRRNSATTGFQRLNRKYYSFFDPNGATDYTTRNGIDRGHWRAAHDQYCSKWQMSGESCYDIYRDGDRIIWIVPSSGIRYDSTLIPGEAKPAFR
jgi:hypothetical protein